MNEQELKQKVLEPQDQQAADAEAALLEGIEPAFHPVVREFGRSMFATVMNGGMAQQAVGTLARYIEHARQRVELQHAMTVLGHAFNQVVNAYVEQMGWTPEQLAQCERAIQVAFSTKIVVPGAGEASRILTGH